MTWPSGDQYIGDWENNQRFEYGEQSIYLEISINAAKRHSILYQHFIDWKFVGLDMVSTCTAVVTDTRANMWLAGRSTLFISCVIILLAALGMVFRILIQAIFRRVLGSFGGQLGYTQGRSLSANLSLRGGKKGAAFVRKDLNKLPFCLKTGKLSIFCFFLCISLQGGPGQLLF